MVLTFLTVAVLLTGAVVVWLGWQVSDGFLDTNRRLSRAARIETLRGEMLRHDEVLSMSARMYAATGDDHWRQVYRRHERILARDVTEAKTTVLSRHRFRAAGALADARLSRTGTESEAFDLVSRGEPDRALQRLLSDEYEQQGWRFADAMKRFADTEELHLRHERLRGTIQHLSEVLSTSAHLAAATGDERWRRRYDRHRGDLAAAIDEARAIGFSARRTAGPDVSRTDETYRTMAVIEQQVFDLVAGNQLEEAQALMHGERYTALRQLHRKSVTQFADSLQVLADNEARRNERTAFVYAAMVVGVVIALGAGWTVMLRTARRWEKALVRQARELVALNRTLDAKVAERTAELRKTAERLRASEDRYRDLFENATDLIQSVRADGRFLYVNRAWRQALEYDEDEVDVLTVEDVIDPDDREHCLGLFQRLMAGEDVGTIEAVFRSRSGRKIFVEGTASCRFEDGRPAYTRGIFRDLSMRRQAEEERDRFFSLSLDLLCIADVAGTFRRLNPAWERTLGWTPEEMLDRPFADLVHPDDLEATMAELDKLRSGINTVHFENRYRCRDGSYRWLVWTCPAPAPNQTALYAAARDITLEKEAREHLRRAKDAAEAASRAKSQFLANMSHELRTPLNAIMGYSYLLQQEAGEEGRLSFVADLGKIHDAGEHLLNLINEVLDLSKIEAGRIQLELTEFSVAAMVRDVLTTVRPLADRNGNRLDVCWGNETGTMYADQTRTRQILFNLLSNAAKFTEDGTIVLRSRREVFEDRDWIRFEIEDTGIGMTEKQLASVFEEFAQADASTTRRYGGTGLGLSITRRFCQLLGGEVFADSEPGRGTTMVVRLPARVTSAVSGVPVPREAAAS